MKRYHQFLLNDLSGDRETLMELLSTRDGELRDALFAKADEMRRQCSANKIYFRGLIEFSNQCARNCFYCGIRCQNKKVGRYEMQENEVLNAALFAHKHRLVSIVIQSGERTDQDFIHKIGQLLERIRLMTYGELSVTLSCGVQSPDTYRYWYESGASRYLLRIESGHPGLFEMLHPNDGKHRFRDRLLALEHLKKLGYQTGTGIMIGLPGQTIEMLAMDLAFFRNFDVDMVGMGPYIEHCDAPLPYAAKQSYTLAERLELSLRMIALLRLLMKDINITASTALQAIDESSRLQALRCGANVIMPNITPLQYREDYLLYDNKPGLNIGGEENLQLWNERLDSIGCVPAWNEAGDPTHYQRRMIQGVTG